jgi:hypothetical protein
MFEKIYDGVPTLNVFTDEDLQHRYFSEVNYVRTVSQPDIDTVFENN